jgi:uncharacterized integral membrane protein
MCTTIEFVIIGGLIISVIVNLFAARNTVHTKKQLAQLQSSMYALGVYEGVTTYNSMVHGATLDAFIASHLEARGLPPLRPPKVISTE